MASDQDRITILYGRRYSEVYRVLYARSAGEPVFPALREARGNNRVT